MSVSENQKLDDSSKKIVDEVESIMNRARNNLRDIRITGLGLIDKANNEAKNYLESIKARSEAKLSEKNKNTNAENTEKEQENFENLINKVSQTVGQTINQTRAYSLAAYEEATENSKKLAEWLKSAFDEAEEGSDEQKAISRLGRRLERTNTAINRLYKELQESTEELFKDAKELGKDVDYELRKAVFGRQESLESRIQAFWKAIGLVNKQEMEEVNRKLVLLAQSLENQLDEESKSLVYLNRRKGDRRVKQVPVAFEKRVHNRREQDRMAS